MKKVGKVLWWSHRDENGVISDSQGNEYYFDKSVVGSRIIAKIERGSIVNFEADRCNSILVAKSVSVPNGKSLVKVQEQFHLELSQLKLPIAI